MTAYRNTATGKVQHVSEGTLLHLLVEGHPDVFEPIKEEVKDEHARKPGRRRSSAAKAADG